MKQEENTVVEYCSSCETEIEMRWDVKKMGYKAYCPVCGDRLMLCDECQHREGGEFTDDCDYDSRTDTCRFNQAGELEKPIPLSELRMMEGKPAYIVSKYGNSWIIVEWGKLLRHMFIQYGMPGAIGMNPTVRLDMKTYGTEWTAYHNQPEMMAV